MPVLYILAIVQYGFKIYRSLRRMLLQALIQQWGYLNYPKTPHFVIGIDHVVLSFASANVLLKINPKQQFYWLWP